VCHQGVHGCTARRTTAAERRVTPTQLQEALTHQRSNGGRLGTSLVRLGILKDDDISDLLSRQYGVASVSLKDFTLDPRCFA